MAEIKKGSFTLPGEAGFESLTLKMAEKWGADVIRDSDGTKLSEDITKAGYGIYSTICVIRADNAWAKKNMDKLQQNFLMSELPPATESSSVERRAGGMNNTLRIRWRRRIRLLICIRTVICSTAICTTKNTRLP